MNRVRKAVFSEAVHKQGILGKGIGIAIVDTGLFPHPDYRSRITGWYDALYQKPAPYDDNGHGSHVAGIAAGAGTFSHGKYKGIAPQANLIGVKVLNSKGNGTIHDIMNGLQWILKNQECLKIRIVNISIGTNDRHAYPEDSAFSFGMPVLSWLLRPVIRDLTHRLLVHPETPEKLSPLARMILPKEPM